MADIFDEIYGGGPSAAVPVAVPTAAPRLFDLNAGQYADQIDTPTPPVAAAIDPFEEVYSGATNSEGRGILNQTLRGVGTGLSLVDELLPQVSKSQNMLGLSISAPHLFGLGSTPEGYKSFPEVFDQVGKASGAITNDAPQTQLGKLLGNVGENAASTAMFGPAAMAASGVFGGTGGYLGEAAFGPTGRTVGSVVGNLSPAGISKLGVIKELGEQIGPTVSQFPVFREIFKNAPIESAVGRALSKSAEDLPATEEALQAATQLVGAKSALQQLKTTSEIAGDTGLMRAEDAVQNMIPSAPFKSIAGERAAIRAEDTLKNYDPKMTPYDVSKQLEEKIASSASAIKQVESEAWKALPKDAPVNTLIDGAQDDLVNAINDITYTGALKVEGEAAGLLKKYQDSGTNGVTSLGVIQELRSKALEIKRATAGGGSAADRIGNKVATAMEEHLRNVVDANAQAGVLPDDAAKTWELARTITRGKKEAFGASNSGTKGLEAIALDGKALDNTALLREGLNSPDKLAAHINAAAAGGQDVKPLYQQALKSELDGAPQSRWKEIIDRKRTQWEQVFTPSEIGRLDSNLADIESELVKNRGSVTSGSATNPRGNVQALLNSEKGIAGISAGFQSAATLGAAATGANYGWKKSETVPGGIANALLYGTGGALLGRGLKSATSSASAKYDEMLINALKDPAAALSAINAAKPSGFGKALADATSKAAVAGGAKGAQSVLGNLLKNTISQAGGPQKQDTSIPQLLDSVTGSQPSKGENMDKLPAKQIIEQIKENPVDHAIMLMESNGDVNAKNKNSTASGLFQLITSTAKKLGVKDVFDPAENYAGYQKLKEDTIKQFGRSDVATIYASHFLGAPTLKKWMNGERLTDAQKAQVKELQNVLLPRLERIYSKITKDNGVTEV